MIQHLTTLCLTPLNRIVDPKLGAFWQQSDFVCQKKNYNISLDDTPKIRKVEGAISNVGHRIEGISHQVVSG